jgi:hypothetical protein
VTVATSTSARVSRARRRAARLGLRVHKTPDLTFDLIDIRGNYVVAADLGLAAMETELEQRTAT